MESRSRSTPFFILGNPRSGTSLLRVLLSGHPELIVPPECGFLLWLLPRFADFSGQREEIVDFTEALLAARKFETWNIDREALLRYFAGSRPTTYAELAGDVYRLYAEQSSKADIRYWGDKNNWYIDRGEDLRRLYPTARFVHIVRDGRDVACSYLDLAKGRKGSAYAPDLPTDLEVIGREWKQNNESVGRQLSGAPVHRLHYEQLTTQPAKELNAVFDFLGVAPVDDFTADAHLERLDEPAEFMAWKAKLRAPVNTSSVGRYRRELSAGQLADFQRGAGRALADFGYPDHTQA